MIETSEYAELQKLCQRSFPERLDQSLTGMRLLPDNEYPTLAFSLTWHEGRRPRVEHLLLRQYGDRRTPWSLDDGDEAQREWLVIRWLYSLGFPVSLPYASGIAGGHGYLLMARPEGSTPRASEDAVRFTARVKEVAKLLARLHSRSPPETVREALPEVHARDEIMRIHDLALQRGDNSLREASDKLEEMQVQEYPLCVVHGDPRLDVVRCDAQGITALLGWETAALGDPRWDVAGFAVHLRAGRAKDLVAPFWAAYSAQTESQPAEREYWEALAALQRWAWGSPAADFGWREETWRALTRLHYHRQEASKEAKPAPDGNQESQR
jgi:aminoglycoside phosphotransferase (APT) family kinase protein